MLREILPMSTVRQRGNTYSLQKEASLARGNFFSVALEHVGVASYCIFILSPLTLFQKKEEGPAVGITVLC